MNDLYTFKKSSGWNKVIPMMFGLLLCFFASVPNASACHVGNTFVTLGPAGVDDSDPCAPTVEICYQYSTPGDAANAYPCSKTLNITAAGVVTAITLTTNSDGDFQEQCVVTAICPGGETPTYGGDATTLSGGTFTDNLGPVGVTPPTAIDVFCSAPSICEDETATFGSNYACDFVMTVDGAPYVAGTPFGGAPGNYTVCALTADIQPEGACPVVEICKPFAIQPRPNAAIAGELLFCQGNAAGLPTTYTVTCDADCFEVAAQDQVIPNDFDCAGLADPCVDTSPADCAGCAPTQNLVTATITEAYSIVYDAATNGANFQVLAVPPLPAGLLPCCSQDYTLDFTLDYTIDPSIPAGGISWTSEAVFEIFDPAGVLLAGGGPGLPGSANNGTPISGSTGGAIAGTLATYPTGGVTLNIEDTFDDANEDGTFLGTITWILTVDDCQANTSVVACAPTVIPGGVISPAGPAGIEWTDAAGNVIGTAATVDLADFGDVNAAGTYSVFASCSCGDCAGPLTQLDVVVEALPAPSLACPALLCSYDPPVELAPVDANGTTATGVVAGPGITDDYNGSGSAIFDPIAAGPGLHTITFTLTSLDNAACVEEISCDIFVIGDITVVDPTEVPLICEAGMPGNIPTLTAVCEGCPDEIPVSCGADPCNPGNAACVVGTETIACEGTASDGNDIPLGGTAQLTASCSGGLPCAVPGEISWTLTYNISAEGGGNSWTNELDVVVCGVTVSPLPGTAPDGVPTGPQSISGTCPAGTAVTVDFTGSGFGAIFADEPFVLTMTTDLTQPTMDPAQVLPPIIPVPVTNWFQDAGDCGPYVDECSTPAPVAVTGVESTMEEPTIAGFGFPGTATFSTITVPDPATIAPAGCNNCVVESIILESAAGNPDNGIEGAIFYIDGAEIIRYGQVFGLPPYAQPELVDLTGIPTGSVLSVSYWFADFDNTTHAPQPGAITLNYTFTCDPSTGPTPYATGTDLVPAMADLVTGSNFFYAQCVCEGCFSECEEFEIVIDPNPELTMDCPLTICEDPGAVTFNVVDAGFEAAFPSSLEQVTGAGTSFVNNGDGTLTVTFDPVAAGAGVHVLTYQVVSINGACDVTTTCEIEVVENPEGVITGPQLLCEELDGVDPTLTMSCPPCLNGATPTIVWMDAAGAMASTTVATTATIDPTTAGVDLGTAGVYTLTATCACPGIADASVLCVGDVISYSITVEEEPEAQINCATPLCLNDDPIQLDILDIATYTAGATPASGVVSGPGVTDYYNLDGTAIFDPSIAGMGLHTITFTLTSTALGACTDFATCEILVQADEAPFVSGPFTVCEGNPNGLDLTLNAQCQPCQDGSMPTITWFDADGTTVIASGTPALVSGSGSLVIDPATDASFDAAVPGLYTYYAQCDCFGCPSELSQTSITVNDNPEKEIVNVQHETCAGDNDGSFDVVVLNAGDATDPLTAGNPVTVNVNGVAFYQQMVTGSGAPVVATFGGLAPGTYTVTTQDANGCVAAPMDVTIHAAPTFVTTCQKWDEICDEDGAISFGVTYAQTTNAADNPDRIVTIALNAKNGTFIAGSTGSGSTSTGSGYVTTGSITYTGLEAGTYTITVEDNFGCTYTETKEIAEGLDKQAPVVENVAICQYNGDEGVSGTPDLVAVTDGCDGTEEIQWYDDANATTPIFVGTNFNPADLGFLDPSVPQMKSYWVSCTCDRCANTPGPGCEPNGTNPNYPDGCMACESERTLVTYMIGARPQLDLDVVMHEKCNGDCDGSLMVDAHDGVAPYTFGLFDGAGALVASSPATSDAHTFTDLCPGIYTVMFLDDAGAALPMECNSVGTIEIQTAAAVAFDDVSSTILSCNNAGDGTITVTSIAVPGFIPEYSLNGGPWQTNGLFTDLAAGTYTITVRNQGEVDCQSTTSVTIGEPFPATPPTAIDKVVCLDNPVIAGGGLEVVAEPCAGCDDPCGNCAIGLPDSTVTVEKTFEIPYDYLATVDEIFVPAFTFDISLPADACPGNISAVSATLDAITTLDGDAELGAIVLGFSNATTGETDGSLFFADQFVGAGNLSLLFGTGNTIPVFPIGTPGDTYSVFVAETDLAVAGVSDDVDGPEGTITVTYTYTYTIPNIGLTPPATLPEAITWWNSPVNGSNVTSFDNDGNDDVFDPIAAGIVNPSIPGTYTYYAQSTCGGCNSVRVPVTLQVLPELPAPGIGGPAFVCPGATESYTVMDDGNMYEWTLDGTVVGMGAGVDITFDGTTVSQTLTITAVDADGCTVTSSLDITQEIDNVMFCSPNKNASVGLDCVFPVTPFTMIKNPAYDESSYAVTSITTSDGELVYDAASGFGSTDLVLVVDPADDNCTQHYVITVEHVCSGNKCSGNLTLEDKTPPTIACPENLGLIEIASFSQSLDGNSPTFYRPEEVAETGCQDANTIGLDMPYSTVELLVTTTDTYTFAGDFDGSENGDLFALIYEGSFDPADACTNLIELDDDSNGGFDPSLTVDLNPGTYVLVVTTYENNNDYGSFDMNFSSANGTPLYLPGVAGLFCTQYDDIYTPEETPLDLAVDSLFTGLPVVSDNCSNFTVSYSDTEVGTSCDLALARTFTVVDACGNVSTCTQMISFTNPDLADIQFPQGINLECDGSGFDQIHPDSLGELYDYPFVNDAITGDLNNGLCNINITYTDQPLEQCGSSYKVLREWTVLDWCAVEAGEPETYVQGAQIIFVTDTSGPEIVCTDQVIYGADPFECRAEITIPAITYLDGCSQIGATVKDNGFPRDLPDNPFQTGDADNDRVWYDDNGDIVDFQGFDLEVTVDGQLVTLFDGFGNPGTAYIASIGDQVVVDGAGDHEIVYSVTDRCGNVSTCTTIITIEDQSAPNPICDENTVVVLDSDGAANICWETFDDGSFDNCDDVIVRVKRMDDELAEFSECVSFDCSDLSYTNCEPDDVVLVRMRVYHAADAANGLLSYEDDEQPGILWNECMIFVQVIDNQAPAIICPPDKFLMCMDDYAGVDYVNTEDDSVGPEVYQDDELIGYYEGPIIDNCDNHRIDLTEVGTVDGCGEGDIYRTYTITDLTTCASHSCTQRINVSKTEDQYFMDGGFVITGNDNSGYCFRANDPDPFDDDVICWPRDRDINCSGDGGAESTHPDDTGRPEYGDEENDCHNLLAGFEDKFHYNDPNNCYRILRTWTVYDWCQYDPNSGTNAGVWSWTQTINVNDDTAPVIVCGDNVSAEANSAGCAGSDGCSGYIDLPIEASDACGGDITFSYEIDAFYGSEDNGFEADITGEGLASDEYPQGSHRIRYSATDACGNTSSCVYDFEIIDVKAPTPICIALNSVTMDASGSLEMWASDFESGSSCDNCTLYDNLEFRIRKANDPTPLPEPLTADDLPSAVTFTCGDCEYGGQEVHVYIFDESGNYDFCLTGINILPGDDACIAACNGEGGPEMLNIAGHIETEDTEMVEDVIVDVSGMNTGATTTGTNGVFDFLNSATPGGNYVVTPEKDINYLNGVTTFDLVLISQHILGVQTLDSPYKIIAADANKSNSVTTIDLVKLQRLILNIDTDLAPNTSWRFVDMDHTFGNTTNPWDTAFPAFPEVINLINLTSDEMAADFVGVKIGDVNGSAVPNLLLGSTDRNIEGNLTLVADETSASKGETFTVDFTADNFTNVLGYQFTLDFDTDAMQAVEVVPGTLNGMTTDNFGLTMLNDGVITTSWHQHEAVTVKSDEVIFSVTFTAISDLKLSDVISISSEVTKAEAYNSDAELLEVDLGINTENGVVSNDVFELLQNSPNPFRGETLIGFNLPTATAATLSITDVSGKLLKVIEGDFVKGYNEVKLDGAQFDGIGVLYYQLDTPTDTATKKMILID